MYSLIPISSINLSHFIIGVLQAADKALDALRRMRAGMRADVTGKKRTKDEVSSLFRPKKALKLEKKPAWKHKFVCLAYKDQSRIPTSDIEALPGRSGGKRNRVF